MNAAASMQRRGFMKRMAAAGGGLLIGVPGAAQAQSRNRTGAAVVLNAYLRIAPDDSIVVTVPVVEMGQGAQTALAALVADELGADWNRLTVEAPPFGEAYRRPDVTLYQLTSGSWSVRLWTTPLRKAAAAAREMLVAAAASRWGVDPASCEIDTGRIRHPASGRSTGFGAVASAAAKRPVPQSPTMKPAARLKLVGQPVPRVDIPSKVDGSGIFGIDVKVPGMVYAAIRQAPVYGAALESVDRASLAGRRGVIAVVEMAGAVMVVADSFWEAKQAVEGLEIRFAASANDQADSAGLMAAERAKLDQTEAARFRSAGDFAAAKAAAAKLVTADYTVPFLHHATMEPMNCTARITGDGCDVWVPTQCQTTAMQAAQRVTGLPESRIRIHTTLLGGGFGRRIETDFIEQALLAARATGRPVKLVWTREEDMQHGFHRPAMSARMSACLDAAGEMTGLSMRFVGPSVHEKFWPAFFKDGLDYAAVMGITTKNTKSGLHYAVAAHTIDYVYQPTHVPIGYWRSVGASNNGFFIETFIDETAQASGTDPYQFRRRLLKESPRALAVLDKAAELAGWNAARPTGRSLGIAFCESVESMVAEVAEVSVVNGAVRVHRVVVVIDCGLVINPDIVEAQIQGGIVNALSATLTEEIVIGKGRCLQSNFHDYRLMRMHEAPRVDVHIIPGGGAIGGVGEAMVPPLAPAVCNAIFAATGRRIRSLPVVSQGFSA